MPYICHRNEFLKHENRFDPFRWRRSRFQYRKQKKIIEKIHRRVWKRGFAWVKQIINEISKLKLFLTRLVSSGRER